MRVLEHKQATTYTYVCESCDRVFRDRGTCEDHEIGCKRIVTFKSEITPKFKEGDIVAVRSTTGHWSFVGEVSSVFVSGEDTQYPYWAYDVASCEFIGDPSLACDNDIPEWDLHFICTVKDLDTLLRTNRSITDWKIKYDTGKVAIVEEIESEVESVFSKLKEENSDEL